MNQEALLPGISWARQDCLLLPQPWIHINPPASGSRSTVGLQVHQLRGHGFDSRVAAGAIICAAPTHEIREEGEAWAKSSVQPWAGAPDRAGERRARQRVGGIEKAGQGTVPIARPGLSEWIWCAAGAKTTSSVQRDPGASLWGQAAGRWVGGWAMGDGQ
jgi:hypothetical protein